MWVPRWWRGKRKQAGFTHWLDADAPSREKAAKKGAKRCFVHWIVTNICGADLHSGTPLCSYMGAGPPKSGGEHRYVFLLAEQLEGRTKFGVMGTGSVRRGAGA